MLTPGANAPLPGGAAISIAVSTARAHADLIALCLDANDRADGDNGVALWSQPECMGVCIDFGADTVHVTLGALPPAVTRVLVVAQADGVADLSACGALSARVAVDGAVAAELSVPAPPPMPTVQVASVYRHGDGWKVRCLGDGYEAGLARLLEVHGIEVSDDEPAPASEPPAESVPVDLPPGVRLTKGEEQLPTDMRKKLSMRKGEVAKVLLAKGAGDVRARVILVLDDSGSMRGIYANGVLREAVERVVALAAQLDDDGEMEVWRFADGAEQLPTLDLAGLSRWLDHCVVNVPKEIRKVRGEYAATPHHPPLQHIGFGNNEPKAIKAIRQFVATNPASDPTLVLFFSDGGINRDKVIEQEIVAARTEPIFWQFIGLGAKAGYGILERLDDLPGGAGNGRFARKSKEIDNVGFFAVDDIDQVPEPELYARILDEFPDWLRVVKDAGII